MAKVKLIQTNFTAGVMDPLLAAREDISFYYNGLEDGYNVLGIPQGGLTRRPGKQHVAELAKKFELISYSGATPTAPQGGTAANATDNNPATVVTTTNNLSTTNPYVVVHVDFGSAKSVIAVDVVNYLLSAGAVDGEFRVQYSTDNVTFSNFGSAMDIDAAARSRRARVETAISARYWRFVRIGATDMGTAKVTVADLRFWQQSSTLSDGRLLPFAYSTDEAYMTIPSEYNVDIYAGSSRVTAGYIPHSSAQMDVMNFTQSLDTMLLFHPSVRPQKLYRQGADDQFDFRGLTFENTPQYDYGAGVGGVNEVQCINVSQALSSADKFTLLLDGERTKVITGDASTSTTATNIQNALNALSNTAGGITVASVTDGYNVTFAGDDGKQPWGLMTVSSMAGTAVLSVSRITEGEYEGEDIMSDTRGWPRAGCFYQDRLHMGGIRELPDALISSVVSEFYNLDIKRDDATKGLLTRNLNDQVGAIYNIVAGRHLTVFANDNEGYIPAEPIAENSVLKKTTEAGSKEGIRVFNVDGALLFVQGVKDENTTTGREVGTSLREFLFIDTEQSYAANNLSKLSGHLIKDPVDAGLRRAVSTKEADMLLLVNNDGTLTAFTTLRTDAVNAFVPQKTRDGDKILRVGVDKKRRVYFIVQRSINGVTRRFIEMWNENLLLDGGGIETMTYENFTATEGQTVFTYTFTSPATTAAVGVRVDGGRLSVSDYSVNLGTKQVTLAEGVVAGTIVRIAKMVKEITGLDHLAGETVQTFVDGTAGEDVAVTTGGVLTLADYADTEIQYGFDFGTYGKMMPFRIPNSETLSGEKIRCCRAILSLYQTGSIDIRANGGNWQKVRLLQLDSEVLDRSTMETLFTGEKDIRALKGFAVGGYVEFRQEIGDMAPLTIRSITREVAI